MYKGKTISISVPAYNVESLIGPTIETIPNYIDYIIVTNDASKDSTQTVVQKYIQKDTRVTLINSEINEGVGASIIKGHQCGVEKGADIMVVMAGDNQMNPKYLPLLLDTVIIDKADYAKGNRFINVKELKQMPKKRIIGNIGATLLVKFASGYWSVADPLNGYTAITTETYRKVPLQKIGKRYTFETSMLIQLGILRKKVRDINIPAYYGKEVSHIKIVRDSIETIHTTLKGAWERLFINYGLLAFHPVCVYLSTGLLLLFLSGITGLWLLIQSLGKPSATAATALVPTILLVIGIQFINQAIIIDIQNEPK
ncbi:glycosyltransferase family 2 protein [candidate division WWE3 bacterium CG08_land_8_20_14_0_20_43_13]|uniref:Glycosyltransferase family 2 protein n=1 Tax=candidate division WWE3 bacterium CG08_land_8_20_14_0_20_43_13 TaxID=1975087 RepID=A0A2H0X7A4_UNCKA|nr:MAG: glycosyltransferase family 2 protein [candidate division WWE3 bacterium CG08_land_8_20_14_0_20_43_13]